MDRNEPRFVDAGLDKLPPRLDDDDIVSAGDPLYDVVKVEVTGPLTLAVEFEDGLRGMVRFMPSYLKGYFAKLSDPAYFARVGIEAGAVSWPNSDPDMAPDTMYDQIKADGGWVLE